MLPELGIHEYQSRRWQAIWSAFLPDPVSRSSKRGLGSLVWAAFLFERLDSNRDAYAAGVAAVSNLRPMPGMIERIDESIRRLRGLHVRGLVSEHEFERELDHVESLRTELDARADRSGTPTITLDGIADGWRRGSPSERRKLLMAFFDKLYVRDGQIDDYVPRSDRRDEVEALIRFATGGRSEVEVLATIPRRGRPSIVAECGKGGQVREGRCAGREV
jgi:hypothetical protein